MKSMQITQSMLLLCSLSLSSVTTSASRSGDVSEIRKVVYKQIGNHTLYADIFMPTGAGPHPAVLVVHGGGWTKRMGDMEWLCEDLAQEGFVAINITYRLAPESHYPAAVEDVRDAMLWLRKNADTYSIDPGRIAGWGYSAGANLVLLAGLQPELGFKALIAGGTPANLTVWPNSSEVKSFLGDTYRDNPKLWQEASPVNHVQTHSPPVFLYHGEWDLLVNIEQMRMMETALSEKGIPTETYSAPYLGHIGVYFFSHSSFLNGVAFLRRTL